jgi:hypothetical protein
VELKIRSYDLTTGPPVAVSFIAMKTKWEMPDLGMPDWGAQNSEEAA